MSERESEMGQPSFAKIVASPDGPPPVLGKYAPFARLGHGGMADVFLSVARGPVGFNKLAVVKRLHRSEDLEMFLDEARLSARLSHPNIVNTYEVGEEKGQYFIAMEYLDGQPLQAIVTDWSARGERIDEAIAAFIAMHALKGLHYAHELRDYDGTPLNVVHRDVSPQNLFVTYQGEIKLLDFGIAKASLNSTQTETGVLKGKIRYMAPEQMVDKTIDRRADVFALGIVLWEMLTGTRLYTGNVTSVLTRVTMVDAPLVRSVRQDLSPELEAIVARALERDPDKRYATADAMRAELEKFLVGKQDHANTALARLVNEGFAVTRDAVRARIKAFLPRTRGTGPTSAPDLAQAAELLPALFGEASSEGASVSGSMDPNSSLKPLANTKSGVSVTRSSIPAPPPARRPGRFIAAGAATLAICGFIAIRAASKPAAAASGETRATAAAGPASVVAPATGAVHLDSSPSGALVEWRGAVLGRTPLDVAIAPGAQTLRVTHDGYEPQDLSVDVRSDVPATSAVALRSRAEAAEPVRAVTPLGAGAAPAPRVIHSSLRVATKAASASPPPPAPTPAPAPVRAKIRVVDDTDAP